MHFTAETDSTYYIAAASAYNTSLGTYEVGVWEDDFSSDSRGTTGTVEVGGSATGEIQRAGDYDWFAVELEAGKTYQFDMGGVKSGVGTLSWPHLDAVYGPGYYNGLPDPILIGGEDQQAFLTPKEDGTYYLAVSAFSTRETGTYTVRVTEIEDDLPATVDTSGTVEIGGTATGEIQYEDDRDWFAVELTAGETYKVELLGVRGKGGTLTNPYLLIRDTPLGKAYVLGTFLTREVTDMGFKVASRVRGLSDEAFREAFGAEEQCRSALSRLRWPDGFVCPACGHRGHCVLAGRSLYQCYRCKKQTSSTAGTIFHATKLPLTLWFAAVHLIVTAKNGISSVELGRRLGVKQPTAWTMKHKIMAVMARREADTPLSGRVEMDDAYLGGARAGGKRGRGAPGKTPFVAAVSTSPEGRPRKVKLVPVKGFRKREIARGAKRWLAPGSEVLTDGLRCWDTLDGVVGSHRAIRTGSGRQAARMAHFKWVNTTLGNIKSAITGTYRKLGPDHAQRYLASFAWRYNRRYKLNTMIPRFVHSAARTQPIPYRALIAG